jgi:outer membrane protease
MTEAITIDEPGHVLVDKDYVAHAKKTTDIMKTKEFNSNNNLHFNKRTNVYTLGGYVYTSGGQVNTNGGYVYTNGGNVGNMLGRSYSANFHSNRYSVQNNSVNTSYFYIDGNQRMALKEVVEALGIGTVERKTITEDEIKINEKGEEYTLYGTGE